MKVQECGCCAVVSFVQVQVRVCAFACTSSCLWDQHSSPSRYVVVQKSTGMYLLSGRHKKNAIFFVFCHANNWRLTNTILAILPTNRKGRGSHKTKLNQHLFVGHREVILGGGKVQVQIESAKWKSKQRVWETVVTKITSRCQNRDDDKDQHAILPPYMHLLCVGKVRSSHCLPSSVGQKVQVLVPWHHQ